MSLLVCVACSRPGLGPEGLEGPDGPADGSVREPGGGDGGAVADGTGAGSDGDGVLGPDPAADASAADHDASLLSCGDITSDPMRCGACDHTCPGAGDPDVSCSAGRCAISDCTLAERAGHSYVACSATKSWSEARMRCQALGLDLLDVNDAAEQVFVKGMLAGADLWIGMNDRDSESDWYFVEPGGAQRGRFVWDTGIPQAGAYVPWAIGQPDGFGDEDCVVMKSAMGDYSDQDCALAYGFVCESY